MWRWRRRAILFASCIMTAQFDRRRVNGPEDTFLPLYNVETREGSTTDAPVWALDEQRLLVDPASSAADQLEMATMVLGDDKLPVPRIARRDFSKRTENRGILEPRPMCMWSN